MDVNDRYDASIDAPEYIEMDLVALIPLGVSSGRKVSKTRKNNP